MTQTTLSCKKCGTAIPENTAFCPQCGTSLRPETSDFTAYSNQQAPATPPPPPPGSYGPALDGQPFTPYAQQEMPTYPPSTGQGGKTPPGQEYWQAPAAIPPRQTAARGAQKRPVILPLTLLVLLIIGTAGFFTWRAVNAGGGTATSGNSGNSSGGTNGTPTISSQAKLTPAATATTSAGGMKTTPINATVTYADDVITIVNVQQASGFPDESKPGEMLRVNIKEETGPQAPYFGTYGYFSAVHLILPDGNSVELANVQHSDLVASVKRTNWFDFQVPVTTRADQITLRLGLPTEHQIDVSKQNDMSKYQWRMVKPNKHIAYGGLNWTLTTAVWRLSAQGVQADKDMSYVVLTLSVDNPSAASMYLSQAVSDAFRLTADGTTTVASKYNTFPMTIAAGETNKTGSVGFLVPQDSTQFTLVMPVYDRGGVVSTVQVTTDFQIP